MKDQRGGVWIGIALIAAGFVPGVLLSHATWNWARARSWIATPATVISADLKASASHQGTSGPATLDVEYRYEWEGNSFENDAISPFNRIEVFNSFKRKQASLLKRAAKDDTPVTCYVNPDDPADAFLNTDFRWASFVMFSVFTMLFAGSGALVVRQRAVRSN